MDFAGAERVPPRPKSCRRPRLVDLVPGCFGSASFPDCDITAAVAASFPPKSQLASRVTGAWNARTVKRRQRYNATVAHLTDGRHTERYVLLKKAKSRNRASRRTMT
jgi:hypothetical protein